MSSAGKWVLGLLLLVVGAVFIARTVSSDPGSNAGVKKLSPAASASAARDAKKTAAATTAGDVVCKKACIEVNEVANDSVTTAKLAPGSVTLSKLAFEVPNLNELENEINARKAAEAATKVAQSEAADATAKNDVAITLAAANGITAESAARTLADAALTSTLLAGDADLLSKLNKEIADRAAGDDALQLKLNNEIKLREEQLTSFKAELLNPNQVADAAVVVKINNNELVADNTPGDLVNTAAVRGGLGGVVQDRTLDANDLGNNAVVGSAAGETLTNVKAQSLRGLRNNNLAIAVLGAGDLAVGTITGQGGAGPGLATGNLALGTVTGQNDNDSAIGDTGAITGNLALSTVGRGNLVNDAIDSTKVLLDSLLAVDIATGAVTTDEIFNDTITNADVADNNLDASSLADNSVGAGELADNAVDNAAVATGAIAGGGTGRDVVLDASINSADITNDTITNSDIVDNVIDAGSLADNSVGSGELADNAVDNAAVATGAIAGGGTGRDVVLDASINSADITNDTITNIDIVDNAIDATSLATGSVGTDEIANGTIKAEDLENGAVTSDKLKLSTGTGLLATGALTTNGVGDPLATIATTPAVSITVGTTGHKVMVTGQTQVTCTCATAGDSADVQWQLYDGTTPVGSIYKGRVSDVNKELPVSVSFLHPAGASATHTYTLRARFAVVAGTPTVNVSGVVVNAVDLGE
jgi:hypothetical protein